MPLGEKRVKPEMVHAHETREAEERAGRSNYTERPARPDIEQERPEASRVPKKGIGFGSGQRQQPPTRGGDPRAQQARAKAQQAQPLHQRVEPDEDFGYAEEEEFNSTYEQQSPRRRNLEEEQQAPRRRNLEADYENVERRIASGSRKAYQMTQDGADKAEKIARQIKQDFDEDINDDMLTKGKFGIPIYLYAFLAYGLFLCNSVQGLLLLAGWVLLCEDSKYLMKLILNVLGIYFIMILADNVYTLAYNVLNMILPTSGAFEFIGTLLKFINKVEAYAFDLIDLFIVIRGMTGAKKGKYIKLKFIEDLFK